MTRRHPITTRSDTLFPSTTLCLSPAELAAPAPGVAPGVYGDMVMRAKEYIAAGDIFQVVLAQRFTTPFPLPPIDLYRALRRINPSPFLYYLDLPGFALIGSSPEILVLCRDGEIGRASCRARGCRSV